MIQTRWRKIQNYEWQNADVLSAGLKVLCFSLLDFVGSCTMWLSDRMLQWRSQNAEKVSHSKGRLLDQATIRVLFKMGTSLKGKNLLPEGANSFLYEQLLIVLKITFITLSDLP